MRFGKTLTVQLLVVGLVFALSAGAQQKPLTQDQVQGLVRSGLGDETGGKLIEQRGIDFVPAEEFLQGLKGAGASEAFIAALLGFLIMLFTSATDNTLVYNLCYTDPLFALMGGAYGAAAACRREGSPA